MILCLWLERNKLKVFGAVEIELGLFPRRNHINIPIQQPESLNQPPLIPIVLAPHYDVDHFRKLSLHSLHPLDSCRQLSDHQPNLILLDERGELGRLDILGNNL